MGKIANSLKQLWKNLEYIGWKHPIPATCAKCCLMLLCIPCTCYFLCLKCYIASREKCGTGALKEAQRKPYKMLDIHFQHQEKRLKRRKSLSEIKSFSLPHLLRLKSRLCNQSQSAFFGRLPPEIRMSIYRRALNRSGFVHLTTTWSRKRSVARGRFETSSCLSQLLDGENKYAWESWHWQCLEYHDVDASLEGADRYDDSPKAMQSNLLSLLISCRRMYMEAISLLYSGNTFAISIGFNLKNFARSIPRRHLSTITSLVLFTSDNIHNGSEEWEDAKKILMCMPLLMDCHFIIQEHRFDSGWRSDYRAQLLVDDLKKWPAKDAFVVDFLIPEWNRANSSAGLELAWRRKLKDEVPKFEDVSS